VVVAVVVAVVVVVGVVVVVAVVAVVDAMVVAVALVLALRIWCSNDGVNLFSLRSAARMASLFAYIK
jgi:uncharacterized membrane protein